MKNLFFVSVAIGIISGTSISATAQTSVNLMRMTNDVAEKIPARFIEGIEISPAKSNTGGKISKKNTRVEEALNSIETCSPLQFKYAQLLDVEVESLTNLRLYEFIESWWGTRYWYGGTTRKGIDCSALAGSLLEQVFGIKAPRTARAMYSVAEKVDRAGLKEGDLVFFNTRGGVSHVGVYLGKGYFTHASTNNGVTISNLDENYYNKRFISGGRISADKIADSFCNE